MTPGARVAAQIDILRGYSVWRAGGKGSDKLGTGQSVCRIKRSGCRARFGLSRRCGAAGPLEPGRSHNPRGPGPLGRCAPMDRIQMSFLPE